MARYSTRISKRKPTSQTGVARLKPLMMAQTIRKTPIEWALCRLMTGQPRRLEFEDYS